LPQIIYIFDKKCAGAPKDVLSKGNIKHPWIVPPTPHLRYFTGDNCAGKEVTTMLCFNRKPAGGGPMPWPPN